MKNALRWLGLAALLIMAALIGYFVGQYLRGE